MDCALWLNRRKVFTADEIAVEPDIASLRGYFLAGTLVEWLYEHGGERFAEKLERLSPDDPELNKKLSETFGSGSSEYKCFGGGQASHEPVSPVKDLAGSYYTGASGSYSYATISSFGSFLRRWELYPSSFRSGSYVFGSGMHEWEWEWLFGMFKGGSFTFGSFTSFYEWEWERLFGLIRLGSFTGGSFKSGSLWNFLNFGSWISLDNSTRSIPDIPKMLDEYDRIMLETLIKCPLDRFGYGIHNI